MNREKQRNGARKGWIHQAAEPVPDRRRVAQEPQGDLRNALAGLRRHRVDASTTRKRYGVGLFEALLGIVDFGNCWLRRRCRLAVSRRPGRLVDPAAPGVRFVEIVPRTNWQRAMLDSAADVGFLHIDAAGGVLLFEGEVERWTCPLAAISATALAESGVPGGQQTVVFVVLAVRDSDGMTRELALRERGQMGMLASERRRRKARELHQEILKAAPGAGR